jgi:hypothetical protein
MALTLTSEDYDGFPSLYSNAGDWKECEVQFYGRFDYLSNEFARVTYNNTGGNFSLTRPASETWEASGFAVGDNIDLQTNWVYFDGAGTFSMVQNWNRNVTYISGNVMHIDAALVAVPGGGVPPVGEVANGREFPTDSIVNRFTDLLVFKTQAAKELQFEMNLTPNGSTSLNSVIDGELIRFSTTDIDIMGLATTTPLTQIGDKSGGYIKDVELTFNTHDLTDHWRSYTLTYKIFDWGVIQDGFDEPNYYASSDHLAPIVNIKWFGQNGNPNTVLEVTSQNTQADTGGFDENYNGGTNPYSLDSIVWKDFLGNTISAMDYTNECTFTAFITAPGQSIPNSEYRIGMVFRPADSTVYQNLPTSLLTNLMVNAPEVDFMHSAITDPTIYAGTLNSSGAALDLTDLQFFISGGTLRVTGKVIPNTAANTYFDAFPDGTRKESLWISIGNFLTDGTLDSERVNLLIFDEDIIDAPTLGVQIPNMVGTAVFDHDNNQVVGLGGLDSTITTEDDCRYEASFKLLDNLNYEGIRVKITAFNSTSGAEFDLEEVVFSFASVPFISGQFQPNFTIGRGFNLPPTTDKNSVILQRLPSADAPGCYGLQVCYGFLSRWEYWLEQANADNDFFDILMEWDGKNKDWQRFSVETNWNIRFELYTILDGVQDFDYHTFGIRPYEDEDVTTVETYTRLSDGTNPTSLVDDELMEVEAVLTYNAGTYELDHWGEATIEDYESGNRWVISSVLPHGGVASNPLEPITGAVGLDLVIVGNVATMKFIIDTNKVNVDQVSLSYRISDIVNINKELTTGEDKDLTTGEVKFEAI